MANVKWSVGILGSTPVVRRRLVVLISVLAVFVSLGVVSVRASNDELAWAVSIGGSSFDSGQGVAVDGSGNVYTTGEFQGTVDFDPGPGTHELTSAGGTDVFVQKLDSDGDLVWTVSMGGSTFDRGYGVAVDTSGNVYTTGEFRGTVDFDPGSGTVDLVSAGNTDVFVQKLNSSGDLVWAVSMGGSGFEIGNGVAVDTSGNVYTTGKFQGTVDFDPGPGTVDLVSAGSVDVFVQKLDSGGGLVWAVSMGGSGGDEGKGVAVDASGNVYTTGEFEGTVDFDPGSGTVNLVSAGAADVFVQKLDSGGGLVWAVSMGGSSFDIGFGVAVDGLGNVYTTGEFRGTVDFDPGPGTVDLVSAGSVDVFVQKLDSGGGLVWAVSMGGSEYDIGVGVAVDGLGNVYTTGSFRGTADFDPGPDTLNLVSAGSGDVFVQKLGPPPPPPPPPPPVDTFIDDNDSEFEANIEWLAAQGITKGCNPPVNDRFCPDDAVTRGQVAAFLVRALDLTDRLDDPFTDDDDSVFEADIERLAAAGITKGCNPPDNDQFCPDNKVTREQMAAFLVRALGYTDNGGGDLFIDDDDSIFEADIDRLATAGVTKGCNPPTNDRFCPTGFVTRGQMAAFLFRALSG